MKISFQKQSGDSSLGLVFFWRMQIDVDEPTFIEDYLIPELFFDYLFIKEGVIEVQSPAGDNFDPIPTQSLKTLHSQSARICLKAPLILFGARFELALAEASSDASLPANRFLEVDWVNEATNDLTVFASQVSDCVKRMKESSAADAFPAPDELNQYSARHQRRLFKKTFGLNRKEMQTIQNVHRFLDQSCDFSSDYPHIIDHVNDEAYYDQPHLNRAFKKVTGFTLLEYFEASTILQDNLMAVSYKDELG